MLRAYEAMLLRLPRAVRARAYSSSSPSWTSAVAPQPPPPVADQPRRERVYASPVTGLAQTFERLSYSYALEDIARGVALATEVRTMCHPGRGGGGGGRSNSAGGPCVYPSGRSLPNLLLLLLPRRS